MLRALWLFAALALVGCQDPSARPAGDRADASAQHSPRAAAVEPTPERPLGKAVLDAGSVAFDGPGGKTPAFAFGTARAVVEASAARRFGSAKLSANQECGAGPMEFARYGAVTFNFQRGKLVGWLAEEGPGVVTTDGIAAGKLLRDLKVARSAHMVEGSTLAGEFEYIAADGRAIGGIVKGEGHGARIVSLFAGANCFFR